MKKNYNFFAVLTLFLVILVFDSQNTLSQVPTQGLVAYYSFNGTAIDESGNGNNGTVNGATLIANRCGNQNSAYYFNGLSDYIIVANSESLSIQNSISLCAWIKTDDPYVGPYIYPYPDHAGLILAKMCTNWSRAYDLLAANEAPFGNTISMYLFDTYNNVHNIPKNINIFNNNWHLVVGTYDYNTGYGKIYIDGVVQSTTYVGVFNLLQTSTPLTIGCYLKNQDCNPGRGYFHGAIDDIRIYNRALTQYEVQAIYNEGTQILSSPALITPANNSTNTILTPKLDWINIDCASSYSLQVSTNIDFSDLIIDDSYLTASQLLIPFGELSFNTQYFWRVKAYNGDDESEWSEIWDFTTQPAPVAECKDITVNLGENGSASILAKDVYSGDNLNSGISSLFIDKSDFNCNDIGNNTVTLSLTDVFNNTTTCTATVTVANYIPFSNLFAWGRNVNGQLGDGTTTYRYSPIQIGTETDWLTISGGAGFSLALKTDGTLWAWGTNWIGQHGDGTTLDKVVPTQIGSSTDWQSIDCDTYNSIAIKSDGSLWAWGANWWGQLGDGTYINKDIPTQVGNSTDWKCAAEGTEFSVAIKTDGTLWAWGYNVFGQLGDGTYTNRNEPQKISTATNWQSISCGIHHTLAVRSDGTLWAWGRNDYGQLGDGTNTNKNFPIQIGNSSNWQSASCGGYFSMAIQSDGSLWAWGWNSCGQLGDGTNTSRNSPTKIGNSDWQSVSCGDYHTMAIKSDGTLWSWGLNVSGQLGDGTNIMRYSPVQIGTNKNWAYISAGYSHSLGIQSSENIPIAICKDISIELDANGSAAISPKDIYQGDDTQSNIKSLIIDKSSFDCSNIGENTVTLTLDDVYCNTSTCTSTVTVVGEIPSPSISVDPEYTVNPGGNSHTIYLGYGPQSVELVASGGTTYSWTSNPAGFTSNEENPTVSPTETTTYSVEVINDHGCTATESITIYVEDIRCGKDKVNVCHNDNNWHTLCISVNAVPAHLAHGDYLGSCDISGKFGIGANEIGTQSATLEFSPNPLSNTAHFTLEVFTPEIINIYIVDIFGKSVANLMNEQKTVGTYTFDFDASDLPPGVYYCHLMVGNEITTMKLVIVR